MEQNTIKPRGPLSLNGFQLKLIALAIMTIDHLAAYDVFPMSDLLYGEMRLIGRIAAPLFLFMNVEGLRHTRNRARFLLRMYLACVLVGLTDALMRRALPGTIAEDLINMLPTFLYVGVYVCCAEALRSRSGKAAAAAAGAIALSIGCAALHVHLGQTGQTGLRQWCDIFLPSPLSVEYSILFVLLGVAWYLIGDVRINCLLLLGLSLLSRAVPLYFFFGDFFQRIPFLNTDNFTLWHLFTNTQWWMFLAAVPMLMYNGERGHGMKYLFYIYYPLHQYLFILISIFCK